MDEMSSDTMLDVAYLSHSERRKRHFWALLTSMQHEDVVKEEDGEQDDATQAETPQQATRKRNIEKQFKHTYVNCYQKWLILKKFL